MINLNLQIERFLNYCMSRKALNEKTIKAYRIDLRQFSEYTDNTFSKEMICRYIDILHERFKPKTVKRKIASIKAFTHYLLIEDVIEINPFNKIDVSFQEPTILPKTIPLNIINSLLTCAYNSFSQAETDYQKRCTTRDIAILEILFATGARVSEICNLTPTSVDLTNHTIKIFGKGSKEYRFEGYGYGGGISYGYNFFLGIRWSIEANLGIGYARLHYDKYKCQKCGEKVGTESRNYFGPTKAGISLIYYLK